MRMLNVTIATVLMVAALITPGCVGPKSANRMGSVQNERGPDARIHISGLACPYCVYNVERSLQHVEGVAGVSTDLNTGVASVWFTGRKIPDPSELREAVKNAGFTPTRIVINGETHEK